MQVLFLIPRYPARLIAKATSLLQKRSANVIGLKKARKEKESPYPLNKQFYLKPILINYDAKKKHQYMEHECTCYVIHEKSPSTIPSVLPTRASEFAGNLENLKKKKFDNIGKIQCII